MNKCGFCKWSVPSDSIKITVPIFYCDQNDICRPESCEKAIFAMLEYNKIRSSIIKENKNLY